MKQRKTGMGFLAVVLLAAVFVWYGGRTEPENTEDFMALDWITALEQKDTRMVKEELAARDEAERLQAEAESQAQTAAAGTDGAQSDSEAQNGLEKPASTDKESLRQRFGQSVIVGDSVAEGFIDYEILDPTAIVAQKGLRADSAGPDIEKALSLSPSHLFLSIGLNDLEYCRGDSSRFVGEYEKRIQEIREKAPDLPIYINAIMPVLPAAVENKPVLAYVDEFNAALKELCQKWEIPFLENGDLLTGHEDWYQKDSVHLTSEPYTLWLARMEEAAGL